MIKLYIKQNIKLLIYGETRSPVSTSKMLEKATPEEQHSRQRYRSMTCIFT